LTSNLKRPTKKIPLPLKRLRKTVPPPIQILKDEKKYDRKKAKKELTRIVRESSLALTKKSS